MKDLRYWKFLSLIIIDSIRFLIKNVGRREIAARIDIESI